MSISRLPLAAALALALVAPAAVTVPKASAVSCDVVPQVASSSHHSLYVDDCGVVWGWGHNERGQVGDVRNADGTLTKVVAVPTVVAGLPKIVKIAAAGAWQYTEEEVAEGETPPVCPLPGQPQVEGCEPAPAHSLALDEDGEVWGWGDNLYAQLGADPDVLCPDATPPSPCDEENQYSADPVQIALPGASEVTGIAAGKWHSVAVLEDGTAWAWGGNEQEQSGVETTGTSSDMCNLAEPHYECVYAPNQLLKIDGSPFDDAQAVSAGIYHTLVLEGGKVWALGAEGHAMLGQGPEGLDPDANPRGRAVLLNPAGDHFDRHRGDLSGRVPLASAQS